MGKSNIWDFSYLFEKVILRFAMPRRPHACVVLLVLCRARATEASKVVVSPITGELIPVDQMAEHMRISLIDPKFQEQRQAMMSKIRETTKASDDEIGRNLMGLARKRPDVFGES